MVFEKLTPVDGKKTDLVKTTRVWSLYTIVQRIRAEEVREMRDTLYEKYLNSSEYKTDLKDTKKVKTPIAFQAPSVLHIVNSLTAPERKEYEKLAAEWSQQGPSSETKQKNATKKFTKEAQHFAQRVWTNMNARLFMLAAYIDESGTVITLPLDFSEVFGESSFYETHKTMIDESDVMTAWDKFSKKTLRTAKVPSTTPAPTAAHIRPGMRALLVLHDNNYNEPLIPNPYYPPDDVEEKKWLQDVIRTLFSLHYALAQGAPETRVQFPWKKFASDPYSFVEVDFFPKRLVSHIGDPSHMTLSSLQTTAKALYNQMVRMRKSDPDAPYFRFKAWWNKEKGRFVEASPRRLREDASLPDHVSGTRVRKTVNWGPSDKAAGPTSERPSRGRSPAKSKRTLPTAVTNDPHVNEPAQKQPSLPETKGKAPKGRTPSKTPTPSRQGSSEPRARSTLNAPPPAARKRSPSKARTPSVPPPAPQKKRAASKVPTPITQTPAASRTTSPTKAAPSLPAPKPSRNRSPSKLRVPQPPKPPVFPSPRKTSAAKLLEATQQPLKSAPLSIGYRSPSKKSTKSAVGGGSEPTEEIPRGRRSRKTVAPTGSRATTRSMSRELPTGPSRRSGRGQGGDVLTDTSSPPNRGKGNRSAVANPPPKQARGRSRTRKVALVAPGRDYETEGQEEEEEEEEEVDDDISQEEEEEEEEEEVLADDTESRNPEHSGSEKSNRCADSITDDEGFSSCDGGGMEKDASDGEDLMGLWDGEEDISVEVVGDRNLDDEDEIESEQDTQIVPKVRSDPMVFNIQITSPKGGKGNTSTYATLAPGRHPGLSGPSLRKKKSVK